jgi:transposase
LEILYSHVGGIDVHKKQITVTARTPDPDRKERWRRRLAQPMSAEVLAEGRRLRERACGHAA